MSTYNIINKDLTHNGNITDESLSNEQLADYYNHYYNLTQNKKINVQNAFQNNYIGCLPEIVKNERIVGKRTNFNVIANAIQAATEIYAHRVENLSTKTQLMLSSLRDRYNPTDSNIRPTKRVVENEESEESESETVRTRPLLKRAKLSFIAQDLSSISLKDNHFNVPEDVYFKKASNKIETRGIGGLLMNCLRVKNDFSGLQINSDDRMRIDNGERLNRNMHRIRPEHYIQKFGRHSPVVVRLVPGFSFKFSSNFEEVNLLNDVEVHRAEIAPDIDIEINRTEEDIELNINTTDPISNQDWGNDDEVVDENIEAVIDRLQRRRRIDKERVRFSAEVEDSYFLPCSHPDNKYRTQICLSDEVIEQRELEGKRMLKRDISLCLSDSNDSGFFQTFHKQQIFGHMDDQITDEDDREEISEEEKDENENVEKDEMIQPTTESFETQQGTEFNNFVDVPRQIDPIRIYYDRQEKRIDLRNLKEAIRRLIFNDQEMSSSQTNVRTTLKEVYGKLRPPLISERLFNEISVPIVFQVVLYLANEFELRLENEKDGSDVRISSFSTPQSQN